jgi:hypothetical protein
MQVTDACSRGRAATSYCVASLRSPDLGELTESQTAINRGPTNMEGLRDAFNGGGIL